MLRFSLYFLSFLWYLPLVEAKTLLVIVNPHAGKGQGRVYYEQTMRPLLEESLQLRGHVLQVLFTSARNEAYQKIRDYEVETLEGIVAVGGDGTVHEIYNGLRDSSLGLEAVQQVPVAHIPLGSGNALAKSIHYRTCGKNVRFTPEAMVQGVIEGKTTPVSLWSYSSKNHSPNDNRSGVFFLGFSYGMVSDIDIDSEWLRWPFGGLRFDLYGLVALWKAKSYPARLTVAKQVVEGKQVESKDDAFRQVRQIWGLNIPYASETVLVAADRKLDENQLHLIQMETVRTGRMNLIRYFLSLKTPSSSPLPFVDTDLVNYLTMEMDPEAKATMDGELLPRGTHRLEISLLPEVKGRVYKAKCE